MKTTIRAAALTAFLFTSIAVNADPILLVSPSETDPTVGSSVDVTVSIDNLGGVYVGDYDLALLYDQSILSFAGLMFGSGLDGPDDFPIQLGFDNPGSAEALEIAFGSLLNQDTFTGFDLFTVTFDVVAAGTSFLNLGVFAIGDFFGSPIPVSIQNSSLTASEPASVPEPGTFLLLSAGLLGIALSRRRVRA